MALMNCKGCGYAISKGDRFCTKCGAKIRRTSLLAKLVTVFFCLFAVMIYLGLQAGESVRTRKAADEAAQRKAEEVRLAALTPEQRASEEKARIEEEKRRQESETEKYEAEQQRLGFRWNYQESDDQMGRGKARSAIVNSLNEVDFGFPYKGSQRATLQLRNHPRFGRDVIVSIERGQFLCRLDGCNVHVRFGSGKPMAFSASEPDDHSTTMLFISNYDKFVTSTKKVDKVFIEATFYQEGNRVFEFDVSSLKW